MAIHRWVKSAESRLAGVQPYHFENELILLALARVYLAGGQFDAGAALLSRLETSAQAGGRVGRLLKIHVLQAVLMDKTGSRGQALSRLERALALGEAEGYVRAFIHEGQSVQRLITQWLSQAKHSPLHAYAAHLLTQFMDTPSAPPGVPVSRVPGEVFIEPLTPRELEVLGLIALGKTNKEISSQLVVSPGTVKAHTSNIYRKLDVSNRTEAVSRARDLNLLS